MNINEYLIETNPHLEKNSYYNRKKSELYTSYISKTKEIETYFHTKKDELLKKYYQQKKLVDKDIEEIHYNNYNNYAKETKLSFLNKKIETLKQEYKNGVLREGNYYNDSLLKAQETFSHELSILRKEFLEIHESFGGTNELSTKLNERIKNYNQKVEEFKKIKHQWIEKIAKEKELVIKKYKEVKLFEQQQMKKIKEFEVDKQQFELELSMQLHEIELEKKKYEEEQLSLKKKEQEFLEKEEVLFELIKNIMIKTEEEALAFLNLDDNYTEEQLKSAYKKMALKYHPDRIVDKKYSCEYNHLFKQVYQAYCLLKN